MNPQCLGYNSTLFEITRSDLIHDGKFLATWMVRHESCSLNWIYPVNITPQNCSLEQKLTSVQFIVFDNFFKVAFVNACLLLWNMNGISRISIKNSITYPNQSQIHFLTGNPIVKVYFIWKSKWVGKLKVS